MQSKKQHSPAQGIGLSVSPAGTSYPTLVAGFCFDCIWDADCRYKDEDKTNGCRYFIAILNPRLEHALQLARDVSIALNEYDRTHPPKIKIELDKSRRNSRAKRYNAKGKFTQQEFKKLCEFYSNKCLCCGRYSRLFLAADHVVPLSKGGDNTIENIQPLCKKCNSKKHTKTIDYRIDFLSQKQECDANNQK